MRVETITITDADALREHMDALNDAGKHCEIAGKDANGTPFLAGLSGAYADVAWAQIGNPWDVEVGFDGETCDCCGAQRGAQVTIDRLSYPVVILGGSDD